MVWTKIDDTIGGYVISETKMGNKNKGLGCKRGINTKEVYKKAETY